MTIKLIDDLMKHGTELSLAAAEDLTRMRQMINSDFVEAARLRDEGAAVVKELERQLSLMKDTFKANMGALTPISNEDLDKHIETVLAPPKPKIILEP